MAYTDPLANYDFCITAFLGPALRGAPEPPAPVVTARLGGALFRVFNEYAHLGLAIDAIDTDLPLATLAAIPENVTRLEQFPAIQHRNIVLDGDYASIDDSQDVALMDDALVFDVTFDIAAPTIACPRFKEWCEAFGGTYTDDVLEI